MSKVLKSQFLLEHPEAMKKGWLVRPEIKDDPACEAKPFLRVLSYGKTLSFETAAGRDGKTLSFAPTGDDMSRGFSAAALRYEAGYTINGKETTSRANTENRPAERAR